MIKYAVSTDTNWRLIHFVTFPDTISLYGHLYSYICPYLERIYKKVHNNFRNQIDKVFLP